MTFVSVQLEPTDTTPRRAGEHPAHASLTRRCFLRRSGAAVAAGAAGAAGAVGLGVGGRAFANASGVLDPALAVGEMVGLEIHPAPKEVPLSPFKDANGVEMTLADFQGDAVLVNFWATWCAPCLREMPSIDALAGIMQEKASGAPFRVVAISLDRGNPGKSQAFLDKIEAKNLPLYLEPTMKISRDMGAVGLPTSVLIDPKGREVARLSGHADWAGDDAVAVATALVGLGAS